MEDTRDFLLETDPYSWHALYQGKPQPDDGTYFKREWLVEYGKAPDNLRIYGASDYATKDGEGDYTVHLVVGLDTHGVIYILDLWREQTESDKWVESLSRPG